MGYCGSPVIGERIGRLVFGGVTEVKLNMLLIGFAMASKEPPPMVPKLQFCSINVTIDVWIVKVWSTKFALAQGEITSNGVRTPGLQRRQEIDAAKNRVQQLGCTRLVMLSRRSS